MSLPAPEKKMLNDVGSTPGDSVPDLFDPFCLRSRELFTFEKKVLNPPASPKLTIQNWQVDSFTRLKVKVVLFVVWIVN